MRLITRLTAGALAAATVVAGVRYGSKVAGGSDSYGYVSQADLLLSGRLSISQPWVAAVPWPNLTWSFTPLAYRPGPGRWLVTPPVPHEERDRWAIVPTYAPGLPLLMAGAKLVAGHCAIFWVVPLCGALLVIATYGIGERMGSPIAGLIAAWLVATSPTTQRMVLEPMSDVPAAAAWALTFWCLFGRSLAAAAGAGLATALAITIRPNLMPLAIVPIGWPLFLLLRSARGERARVTGSAAAVIAGIAAGVAATAAIQWAYYGSPYRSGYGALDQLFDPANVRPNLRAYTTWFASVHTPLALAGFAALLIPARQLWGGITNRGMVVASAIFVAGLVTIYLYYTVFDSDGYLRFLLSAWPFVMLGLAHALLIAVRLMSWNRAVQPIAIVLVTAATLFLGLRGVSATQEDRRTLRAREARYVTVATRLREISGDDAIVLAIQHSGSIRYYAGRMTLAWEALPPPWLDRAIAWLIERGRHPYAVLEDWEIRNLRTQYAGQASVALFETPIVQHALVYVFDLKPDPSRPVQTEVIDAADVSCRHPAPSPTVEWR